MIHQDCPGGWRPVIQSPACETALAFASPLCWTQDVLVLRWPYPLSGLALQTPRPAVFCAVRLNPWLALMGLRTVSVGTKKTWLGRCLHLSFLLYQGAGMRSFLSTYHDLGRRLPWMPLHTSGITFVLVACFFPRIDGMQPPSSSAWSKMLFAFPPCPNEHVLFDRYRWTSANITASSEGALYCWFPQVLSSWDIPAVTRL